MKELKLELKKKLVNKIIDEILDGRDIMELEFACNSYEQFQIYVRDIVGEIFNEEEFGPLWDGDQVKS